MNRPPIPTSTDFLTTLVLKITYYFDEPALNCFPSIHCLFCFQVIFSYITTKTINNKYKIFIITFAILIIISTVLVKQHYIFDVFASLLITIITNLIVEIIPLANKFQKKIEENFS